MTTKLNREPNRLINEKSPYLLQHAYNPVNWYSWSNEALEKAKSNYGRFSEGVKFVDPRHE